MLLSNKQNHFENFKLQLYEHAAHCVKVKNTSSEVKIIYGIN